jgi:hypothetical protein
MKNKEYKVIMIITFFLMVTILYPTIGADPSIIITNYKIFPNEFMPGDKGILLLTIQNTETTATTTEKYGDATDSITIVENNGVVINKIWINSDSDDNGNKIKSTAGTTGYKNFGNIAPGAIFQVSFELIAEENISEGYYFPDVKIDLKNDINGNYEDVTFPIEVRVSNETVDLISNNVPSKISIGGSTDVSFSVVNNRMESVEGITLSSNKNNELEFNPKSIFIGSLDSGESKEVTISLHPTELGNKNLSINLSYVNGNNPHYHTYNTNLEIIEVLDVAPILYSVPTTIEKGRSTRITLEVFNAKTESITGVIVKPITKAIIIPTQYYIGAMDSDDVFSASFDLYTDKIDYGNYTLDFQVSFKQGNEIYETPAISSSFTVVPMDDNSVNRGYILPVGIIASAIVSMILFLEYKKRRRNS